MLGTPSLAQSLPSAQSQPQALTLETAVSQALLRHPDILAAKQRVVQAESRLTGARALPNPELDIGYSKNLDSVGAGATGQDIQLTQRLNVFGQRSALTAKARNEADVPRFELRLIQQEVTFRVRTAWYNLQSAQAGVEFAQQALGVAEIFSRLADSQYKAGEVPIANVLRSEFEVENARQALLIAQTNVSVQVATLNTLLQQPLSTPLAVPSLASVTLKTYDKAALLKSVDEQPQVQSARATVVAQKAGIAVAKSASKPELAVVYAHNQLQNWLGGNSYRVGVILPLFDRGQFRASVQEAQAATAEKEASLGATQQQVLLDLTTAIYLQEQARVLVPRTGEEQLKRAQRLYQLAETGYREGATSYLNVLDALGVLRSAYQSHLKALTDYNIAEAGLERALGAALPAPLSTQPMRYEPPTLSLGNEKKG
ncbi:TolC family protein [Armatimonas rosea]|uniref:Cobalt-zinc-cadmium efflux system outer membrane protein n=1 Tax=Armatimonas rosea TaxID=685828 RepID=A0A7W9WAX5_ARMRO|nr:TolC family protein [Armatimonas rosea]MBB6054062.1 cobalt-zinc-cadmium efflux system outer membrane protein [Armatimonas rosea]